MNAELGKSQQVRLLDVFVLGPFMVWFAYEARDVPDWARLALGLSGAATIAYNARNYVELGGGP